MAQPLLCHTVFMGTPSHWQQEDFGPYRLLERLGVGGMATVHRAIHVESGERVALKRLLPQLAGDAMLIEQFRREAEIARSLAHPNMACVHDFGDVDGVYYLTMEEVDGPSVLDLLRRANEASQPAPIGVSLWILREILCALDYAMTGLAEDGEPFNIVHRDLSPSNIIINRRGEVKIIDFGVAKSLRGRYATNSGRIKGKLGYMSPEALAGRAIDSRSDLYSLAVLAWELLTAKRLFRGNEREQMSLRAKNHERTPPSIHNREVPQELDRLLAVALLENRDHRWASAYDMLCALEPLLEAEGANASPRALRDWMKLVTAENATKTSLLEARHLATPSTPHVDSHMASRGTPLFVPSVTIPTSSIKIPGVRRFPDVRTAVDPVFDARERHRENSSPPPIAGAPVTGAPVADAHVAAAIPVAPRSGGAGADVPLALGSSEFVVPTRGVALEPAPEPATEAHDPDTMEIHDLLAVYVSES